jgi:hypothetical protein
MKKPLYFASILVFLLASCSKNEKSPLNTGLTENYGYQEPSNQYYNSADTVALSLNDVNSNLSGSLTANGKVDKSGHMFVRTAEIKSKVKNVKEATLKVENLADKYEGFITLSDLRTSVTNTTETRISADSTLESKFYIVENHLVVRVPNKNLDSLLKELDALADFMDYRIIKAEDVSLELLANERAIQRVGQYDRRIATAIDNRGKKLGETSEAEDIRLQRQREADQAQLKNMGIKDQLHYSTIRLTIYQRETVWREVTPDYENITSYRPNFFYKIGESLVDGWYAFEQLILFLFRIWFVFLIAGIGFAGYKLWKRQIK